MGVTGLLTLLKSIQKPCSLKDFRGKTIAVDAYGWLHRGAIACAIELATGKPTTKFVDFAMHRVRMLLHFGVTPYLVFDGDRLPSKAGTEHGRAERRRESQSKGLEYLRTNQPTLAYQELQKAIDITPEMARMLIDELKFHGVPYIVAPYEADPQMVYLEKKGIVDGILSEDSDLLVFGAKCLLTKLDQYGACVAVKQDDFAACREVNLTCWSMSQFRCMAILSGCDYLPGIPSMGLRTAHRLVRKYKVVEQVIRGAQLEGKKRIPPGYLESYFQAEKTFLHQWVFCPQLERLVNLTSPDGNEDVHQLPYIGAYVEPDVAKLVSTGDLNPMTKQTIKIEPRPKDNYKTPLNHKYQLLRTKSEPAGKTIESFFKPNRIPLAELDPNSFTPSPSQQRLQETFGNSRSWPSQIASERVYRNTIHQPRPVSSSAPTSSAVSRIENPAKRQRLCEDPLSPRGKTGGQLEISPFFDAKPCGPSPLVGKGTSKRAKKADFAIYSDDSTNAAMADLASQEEVAPTELGEKTSSEATVPRLDDVPETAHPGDLPFLAVAKDEENGNDDTEDESPFSAALLSETRAMRDRSKLQRFALTACEPKKSKESSDAAIHGLSPDVPAKVSNNKVSNNITTTPQTRRSAAIGLDEYPDSACHIVVQQSPAKDTAPSPLRLRGSEDQLPTVADSDEESSAALLTEDDDVEERVPASSPLACPEPVSDEEEEHNRPRFDVSRFAFGPEKTRTGTRA